MYTLLPSMKGADVPLLLQAIEEVNDPIPCKGMGLHVGVTSARLVQALAD